jgi:hypothetical protein
MILHQCPEFAGRCGVAADEGVTVQKLSYPKLRKRLLAQNQVLDPPVLTDLQPEPKQPASIDLKTLVGIVLDNASAELKGPWARSAIY